MAVFTGQGVARRILDDANKHIAEHGPAERHTCDGCGISRTAEKGWLHLPDGRHVCGVCQFCEDWDREGGADTVYRDEWSA